MEGRGQPEGSPREKARVRTQSRVALPPNLERVNAAAKQAAQTRFTALLHQLDEDALLRAFRRQKRQASVGVDGVPVAKTNRGVNADRKMTPIGVYGDPFKSLSALNLIHWPPRR